MTKYLGETDVDINTHPLYKEWTPIDWAMYHIEHYGGFDGDHHKAWVLDQIARIHHGTKPIVKLAQWDEGNGEITKEYRVTLGEPTQAYHDWVIEMKEWNEEEQEYDYGYEVGIPP
jgi:hypothetical protein